MKRLSILAAAASLGLLGCAAAPARVPELPTGADEATRRAFFDQYELHGDIGFWSNSWKRADGKYSWGALKNLSKQFPESDAVYRRAETRDTVIGTVAAVGGGVEGFTLGYGLAAPKADRMSTGTEFAFYGVGGGLVLVSLVVGLVWHNPAEEFADAYDNALRRALGVDLPAHSASHGGGPAAWVPELIGQGYGYRF